MYTGEKNLDSDAQEILAAVNVVANAITPVTIRLDPGYNFYGYKVDGKVKVFCVGEDYDRDNGGFIFYMYNTENTDQSVTTIKRVVR